MAIILCSKCGQTNTGEEDTCKYCGWDFKREKVFFDLNKKGKIGKSKHNQFKLNKRR